MAEAYIVAAVRSAGGRRNGRLMGWHPVDLAGAVLSEVARRSAIDPAAIDDVIMGCVGQVGEQALHVGRNAVLASTLPDSVPAVTIDRQCGSSQQAIQFAAQAVLSGTQDVVIAAGIEHMSRVPMGTSVAGAKPFSDAVLARYGVRGFSQFAGAEMVARKHGLSREALDAYALESHVRAAAAVARGDFDDEILPLEVETPEGPATHAKDEGIRFDASAEGLAALKPLAEGGVITAGNASQICDGAAAVMIVSEAALKTHGLTPLARIAHLTVTAGDPVIMLEEPLFATDRALARAGRRIDDIDLYEVNEAFASVPLAWAAHVGADPARLNVNGGAIALGHPLGASGAKLMTTLVHALRRRGLRHGLQTMCEGGGIANVTLVEAL